MTPPVEAEEGSGRVALKGIGRLGGARETPCSLIIAIEAVLRYLGHAEVDYTWLMGVSGAAFHMRWHPLWQRVAAAIDDPLYCDHAFAASGRAYWYTLEQPTDLWAEVTRALDAGRPVLAQGFVVPGEYSVIAAYDEDGQRVFGRTTTQSGPEYVAADKPLERMGNLILVGAAGIAPDRRTCEIASLGTAISVLRGASRHWAGGQVRGVAAWGAWATALRDDAALAARAQAATPSDLASTDASLAVAVGAARRQAGAYLRRVGPNLPGVHQREAVTRAAAAFEEVAVLMEDRAGAPPVEAGQERQEFMRDAGWRSAWASSVEKAGRYDQVGLLALEEAWHAPPAPAAQ